MANPRRPDPYGFILPNVKRNAQRTAFLAIGARLQEQSTIGLSHSNIRSQLQNTLDDVNPGMYCWVVDVFGDDQSGDVIYSCAGDTKRARYELSTTGGNRATILGYPVDVLPRMIWDDAADDGAHMTAMLERMNCNERFITKADRDNASAADFAGKNRSFPILKPEDVTAAVRSMGRAGAENYSASVLKANIIKIAKRKGWASHLPTAWQTGSSESAGVNADGRVLTECCERAVFLTEAGPATRKTVRLISPGWGSSGYYSSEVLKRDGPKIFPSGTHMYLNHATPAEESQRPEGDIRNLAAVTSGNAYWDANHNEGAGLFAQADIFSQYAPDLLEKAPFTGVSIRARGYGQDGEAEGKKGFLVTELFHGESVDFVTKSGRGGKVLTESGNTDPTKVKESDMDKNEVQTLIEAAVGPIKTQNASLLEENGTLKADVLKFRQRNLQEDARRATIPLFATARTAAPGLLTEAVQERITARVLTMAIPVVEATGEIDAAKFKATVEAEIKNELAYIASITGSGAVRGLGESFSTAPVSEVKDEDFHKRMKESFIAEGYTPEQAEIAAKGRVN